VSPFVLVRHASAGSRRDWVGDDRLRPLDASGERQTRRLVEVLVGIALDRVVTSPYARCVETVRPLAMSRGLDFEERMELAEGVGRSELFALLNELEGSAFLLCTHGDVIYELLGEAMAKGEIRIVERDGDRFGTVD
jgi:phosphohistidine phosphatase SixA